jgi:hypothetical protein
VRIVRNVARFMNSRDQPPRATSARNAASSGPTTATQRIAFPGKERRASPTRATTNAALVQFVVRVAGGIYGGGVMAGPDGPVVGGGGIGAGGVPSPSSVGAVVPVTVVETSADVTTVERPESGWSLRSRNSGA